ncbi:DUF4921 family protein [Candidatus Woesearchaeota archaeon]|nr:DUF4921 family protein [Candidatus Woesearchaeota archaeon]
MELRKDYILDSWVYFAVGRKSRPKELPAKAGIKVEKACTFCPGNESLTPPEIGRVEGKNGWLFRWFHNKFPAVDIDQSADVFTDNTFFTYSSAYGRHEIISETPRHDEQLWDLDQDRVAGLMKVYFARIGELSKLPFVSFVSVFKNHGLEAGASLIHSHTQITAISMFPKAILDEASACRRFGSCPYCRILNIEKSSLRRCFENSSFVAFAPYASRFNYEVWIFPKRHVSSFLELSNGEVSDLSGILVSVLGKLKSINASYNFVLHYSGKLDLHAHIEVMPRLAVWAGFEFSTGATINSVLPEDAAAFYRGENQK